MFINIKNTYRSFLFLLFVSLPNLSFSSDPVAFEHINRSNGLPSNSITAIIQDKYGMMWFGTYNGLVRFNGYDYKIFTNNPTDSNSHSDNFINNLALTKDGNLLVGHRNHGFSIFDYKSESFKRFSNKPGEINSLGHDNIFDVHSDKKGNIWIGTLLGLDKFEIKTGKFTHYHLSTNQENPIEKQLISSIVEENDGQLLLFVSGMKIVRFNPENELFTPLKVDVGYSFKARINKGGIIFKDKQGFLWIGTEQDGLIRFDERTNTTFRYKKSNSGETLRVIMHIMQDSEDKIWVSTDGNGLIEFNYSTDKFIYHTYDPQKPTSIGSNAVYFSLEDKSKHIWVATYAAGINIIKKNKKRFELYTNNGFGKYSLSYKSVLSFEDNKDGKIWVGTDGGGLNLFDPKTKTFEWITKENSGICSNIIKTLLKDDFDNLWIGTYASGLCKANFKTKEFKHYLPENNPTSTSILGINVWSIAKGNNGDFWLGELNAGLDFYNATTRKFEHILHEDDSATIARKGSVMTIMVDKSGKVWIGTQTHGVQVFDPKTKKLKIFINDPKNKSSIISNNTQTIIQDSKGFIWIGTRQGGVSKLIDYNSNKFINYTQQEGLAGNTIFGIIEDDNHNFWISTDNGVSMLDTKTNTFRSFDKSDGLQSLEFAIDAAIKGKDGFIYLGGTDGFNRFHPDSIKYNTNKPEVFITGFNLFNKNIESKMSYNNRVYFDKALHLLDTIKLNYTDYVFSIAFSAIDYTTPERNKFAYRLEGFEDNWNYVDATKRLATYTNLNPGHYIFHVKAANNDGVWNEKGKSILIIIYPAWWQTWWFRIICAILIASTLIGFYYFRLHQIRDRNIVLYKIVKHKTGELEEKNTELLQSNNTKDKLFSIIGHDLRNPVSALSTLTDMLQTNYAILGDKDKAHIIDHIQSSSNALKLLVNNLLDWALVQSKHLNPHPTIVETKKATEECFKLVRLLAHSKNITLENLCADSHYVFADPNMFHTILRNIVSNSIKFTPKEGKVSIESIEIGSDKMLISITDTGIGMSKKHINQLLSSQKLVSTTGTSNEKGSGLGLVVVKEFIEANKGYMTITSIEGKGTKFMIQLPMMQLF